MSFGHLLECLCSCAVRTSALSYVTLYCDHLAYDTVWCGRLNNDYQTARCQLEEQVTILSQYCDVVNVLL
jgi:hypothetical protein